MKAHVKALQVAANIKFDSSKNKLYPRNLQQKYQKTDLIKSIKNGKRMNSRKEKKFYFKIKYVKYLKPVS